MPQLVDFHPDPIDIPNGWKMLEAETLAETPWIRLDTERWHTAGREGDVTWTVAHRKSAIAIAAMTEDERFLMVRQERVSIRRPSLEFVAGQVDDVEQRTEPEVILETIERELAEEAGYAIPDDGEVVSLGHYFTSPGFTNELIYLFFVRGVIPISGGNNPDSSEVFLGSEMLSAEELRTAVAENRLVDSLSLSLFARMTARGLL
ncbi:MAG: NUDIX hydrolase [Verrucomicrobiota bacterium]